MATFLHTADVHLDTPFSANFNEKQMQIRRREVMQTFRNVVLAAKEKDFLFISGDLFDGKYVSLETISFVKRCFAEIPETAVFIAAGNHDPFLPNSVYARESFGENVHVFGTEWEYVDFPDKKVRVHGRSFEEAHHEETLLKEVCVSPDWCNLMVLHGEIVSAGGKSMYNPIEKTTLAESGMDYVALGHIHLCSKLERRDGVYYAYCGTPEGRGFDEEGEKGYYEGTAEKGLVELVWHPSSCRKIHHLPIVITNANDVIEVQEIIADNIKQLDGNDGIYKVILQGRVRRGMIQAASLEHALESIAFYLTIVDETKPEVLPEETAKENSLRGAFAEALLKRMETMTEEEKEIGYLALELGLSAMERGQK